jgi:hypothetical protein
MTETKRGPVHLFKDRGITISLRYYFILSRCFSYFLHMLYYDSSLFSVTRRKIKILNLTPHRKFPTANTYGKINDIGGFRQKVPMCEVGIRERKLVYDNFHNFYSAYSINKTMKSRIMSEIAPMASMRRTRRVSWI